MMEDSQRLGARLKETREKKGITYEDVYNKVRIHPKMVEDLEAGRFDAYNAIYVKSFLKKYSDFLGLDSGKILEHYKNLKSEISSPGFGIENDKEKKKKRKKKKPKPPKEKKPKPELDVLLKKIIQDPRVQSAFAVVLVVFLVFLIFTLFTNLPVGEEEKDSRVVTEKRVSADRSDNVSAEDRAEDEAGEGFTLSLEAEETAWLQISETDNRDNVIFVGEIKKGRSRTWELEQPVNIWTGKAEALSFTLNNTNAGKVADGVERNIRISSEKIEVAGETVFLD